jgi:hypothetical protein
VAGEDQGHEPKRTTRLLEYVSFVVFPKARLHLELKKKGQSPAGSAVSEIDSVLWFLAFFHVQTLLKYFSLLSHQIGSKDAMQDDYTW